MKKLVTMLVVVVIAFHLLVFHNSGNEIQAHSIGESHTNTFLLDLSDSNQPQESNPNELVSVPSQKVLTNISHVYQTFNNCGPASLSMALSYFGIIESQQSIGRDLRPYQHPNGDNDDKSVTLEELAEKSKEYGIKSYHRPVGNIELLKLFITYDMPVITKTLTKPNEDIGHYRVVKGFDDINGYLVQDDSLQGKNLRYTYAEFNEIWKKFNYEYLVLVPVEKVEIAKKIIGENVDRITAWNNSIELSLLELEKIPNDVYARFNLSVALYNIGNNQESIEEFEKIYTLLPQRTLWYQIEPILAYYETGNYAKVFEISDQILNNGNRAFSELYLLRGEAHLRQGQINQARQEFEKAMFYNSSLKKARVALQKVG